MRIVPCSGARNPQIRFTESGFAAAGRTYNSEKFSRHQFKGYMGKGSDFPGRHMVGKGDISYFQKWFHRNYLHIYNCSSSDEI